MQPAQLRAEVTEPELRLEALAAEQKPTAAWPPRGRFGSTGGCSAEALERWGHPRGTRRAGLRRGRLWATLALPKERQAPPPSAGTPKL